MKLREFHIYCDYGMSICYDGPSLIPASNPFGEFNFLDDVPGAVQDCEGRPRIYLASDVDALLADIRELLAARAAANLEAEFLAMLADTGGER